MDRVAVAILAAGTGARFGADKTLSLLGDRPVWKWSFDTFSAHPGVSEVFFVGGANSPLLERESKVRVIAGGATRLRSSFAATQHSDAEILLVHDAARPFIDPATISSVIAACRETGAAAPVIPVFDTIRDIPAAKVVDRQNLVAMQTPQGARTELLRRAHEAAKGDETDEIALLENLGVPWQPVQGRRNNFKLTTPEDLAAARRSLVPETRTGLGYDIHRFSKAPDRPLWLGGVLFPDEIGLEGHSDADAVLHAVVDSLLGAAALGDIGQHFPPSDPKWKDMPSSHFLAHSAALLSDAGWKVVNVDISVIAERPKVMPRSLDIRSAIAAQLDITIDRVSVKATTNEGLGSLGRGEGLAAYATATIRRALSFSEPE